MPQRWIPAFALAAALAFGGGLACQTPEETSGQGGSGEAGRPYRTAHSTSQSGFGSQGYRGEDTALAAGNSSGGAVGGNTTVRAPATSADRQASSGGSGSLGMAGVDVPQDFSRGWVNAANKKASITVPAPLGRMTNDYPAQKGALGTPEGY